MSQNDFTISNQTFPNTRADINLALQALASTSSGSSAPSTTFANQLFYNTTSNLLQIRNEDNDAFITIAELDQSNDTVEYFKSDSVRTALIEFTDGDDALAIADGGALTVSTSLDMNGTELILDADADTSITADTDDRIDIKVGNSDVAHITTNAIGGIINRNNAKPIIINGAMEVWQRGTALASDDGNYAADRFWYSGTGATSQRNTDAPSGFTYSNKLTYGSADMSIGQPVELPVTGEQGMFIAGQTLTVAFYGKVDATTESINVVINARNSKFSGTDSTSFTTSDAAVTLTTAWQRFTKTFTIPTINSNNVMLAFELAQISKTAYFTGFQFELGTYDTTTIPPFQHEAFQDNFFRCQRYYQNQGNNFYGMVEGTDKFRIQVPFDRPMRTSPSTTARGAGFKFNARYLGDHTTDDPTISDAASTTFGVWLGVNGTSLSGNTPIYGRSQQDAAGQFLALSAEF